MLQETEIDYLSQEIKRAISDIEATFGHEYWRYQQGNEQEEYPGYTRDWIKTRIRDLYYNIRVYFEIKGLIVHLNSFITEFDSLVLSQKDDLLKTGQTHPESEGELKIIIDFKRFLDPFKAFDYREQKGEVYIKVHSILKHTDHILKKMKFEFTPKTGEASIYENVKWVLGLFFPKTKLNRSASFNQTFQRYNPDILIPEIKTAIEYKYVKDRRLNLDTYLDQIRIDAANYTEDSRYDNFIAVLYIKDSGIATEDNIRAAWVQKRFPKNWSLVVAMGS
jgi:hypothetical protein